MAANANATGSVTVAFRTARWRKEVLREIQRERQLGNLSDVLQEAVDDKIRGYLAEKGLALPAGV